MRNFKFIRIGNLSIFQLSSLLLSLPLPHPPFSPPSPPSLPIPPSFSPPSPSLPIPSFSSHPLLLSPIPPSLPIPLLLSPSSFSLPIPPPSLPHPLLLSPNSPLPPHLPPSLPSLLLSPTTSFSPPNPPPSLPHPPSLPIPPSLPLLLLLSPPSSPFSPPSPPPSPSSPLLQTSSRLSFPYEQLLRINMNPDPYPPSLPRLCPYPPYAPPPLMPLPLMPLPPLCPIPHAPTPLCPCHAWPGNTTLAAGPLDYLLNIHRGNTMLKCLPLLSLSTSPLYLSLLSSPQSLSLLLSYLSISLSVSDPNSCPLSLSPSSPRSVSVLSLLSLHFPDFPSLSPPYASFFPIFLYFLIRFLFHPFYTNSPSLYLNLYIPSSLSLFLWFAAFLSLPSPSQKASNPLTRSLLPLSPSLSPCFFLSSLSFFLLSLSPRPLFPTLLLYPSSAPFSQPLSHGSPTLHIKSAPHHPHHHGIKYPFPQSQQNFGNPQKKKKTGDQKPGSNPSPQVAPAHSSWSTSFTALPKTNCRTRSLGTSLLALSRPTAGHTLSLPPGFCPANHHLELSILPPASALPLPPPDQTLLQTSFASGYTRGNRTLLSCHRFCPRYPPLTLSLPPTLPSRLLPRYRPHLLPTAFGRAIQPTELPHRCSPLATLSASACRHHRLDTLSTQPLLAWRSSAPCRSPTDTSCSLPTQRLLPATTDADTALSADPLLPAAHLTDTLSLTTRPRSWPPLPDLDHRYPPLLPYPPP
ncbi:hypothetical protein C7M84_020593 [Penaeus vannamei]|uniref:Uncharacterized protein n=1 Tax=Penaeus vannamei TaxID=6689 RepID=A0A3R7QAC2_PENVA|nr:hypothetical protein C7M84_020593 [Penaeus vannamei]